MINLTEIRALILEMRALFENGSPAGLEAILPSFREFQKKVNRELFLRNLFCLRYQRKGF